MNKQKPILVVLGISSVSAVLFMLGSVLLHAEGTGKHTRDGDYDVAKDYIFNETLVNKRPEAPEAPESKAKSGKRRQEPVAPLWAPEDESQARKTEEKIPPGKMDTTGTETTDTVGAEGSLSEILAIVSGSIGSMTSAQMFALMPEGTLKDANNDTVAELDLPQGATNQSGMKFSRIDLMLQALKKGALNMMTRSGTPVTLNAPKKGCNS